MREVTGLFNIVGNKGCVGISFDFDGTSFGVISSHLAAHQHKMQDRNNDYRQICSQFPNYSTTYTYHHILWLGDLKYRINYQNK